MLWGTTLWETGMLARKASLVNMVMPFDPKPCASACASPCPHIVLILSTGLDYQTVLQPWLTFFAIPCPSLALFTPTGGFWRQGQSLTCVLYLAQGVSGLAGFSNSNEYSIKKKKKSYLIKRKLFRLQSQSTAKFNSYPSNLHSASKTFPNE